MRRTRNLIVLAFAAAALLAGATAGARGYTRCVNCGTVVDVDPIVFDETDANRGAEDGAVLAGVLGSHPDTGRQSGTIADVAVNGLIGRLVRRNDTGPGTPGTRLEVKLDTGGHNIVEVKGRVRIYRDDRVRLEKGRIALNY